MFVRVNPAVDVVFEAITVKEGRRLKDELYFRTVKAERAKIERKIVALQTQMDRVRMGDA